MFQLFKDPHTQLKKEISRKLVHLSSLWLVYALFYLDKTSCLWLFSGAMLITFLFETIKTSTHIKLLNPIRSMLREHEKKNLTGAFYVLLAALLVVAFCSKYVAILSLLIMLLSDSVASLVGRAWGRVPIFEKTLEGSMAFFIITLLILIMSCTQRWIHASWVQLSIIAFLITIVELFSRRLFLDDNLTITASCAILLSHIS